MARHCIISGGSSGIGLALALQLAADGWDLTIMARKPDQLDSARKRILDAARRPDASVCAVPVDVCDEAAVQAAVQAAVAELGPPSLVVASAGIVIPGRFFDLSSDAFMTTMAVNYFGSVHLVRAALASMRPRRSGHIVLVSSGAGLVGFYGYTAYAPSKFAVRGLAEALRSELVPDGIGVHIVYPPDTDTPQLRGEMRERPEATTRIVGNVRIHSPEGVAAAIIRGVERGSFTIAPGWKMRVLAGLNSLIVPLLNKFSFDPIVASLHGKGPKN
jgi:3-dehydrosphinganine reductase